MSQTYTLILDSQNATNITNNNNIYQYSYYINWDAILSRKYENYSLTYTMKTNNASQLITTFTGGSSFFTFSGTILNNILTVYQTGGSINVGNEFNYNGINFAIVSQSTGTAKGVGTYIVDSSVAAINTFSAVFDNATGLTMTVTTAPANGGQINLNEYFYIGTTLNQITALGTGTGGIGTYTIATAVVNPVIPSIAVFQGTINTTTLTISALTSGTVSIGLLFLTNGIVNQITGLLTGTLGAANSTYSLLTSSTVATSTSFTAPGNLFVASIINTYVNVLASNCPLIVGSLFYYATNLLTIATYNGGSNFTLTSSSGANVALAPYYVLSPPTTCSLPIASNALAIDTFTVTAVASGNLIVGSQFYTGNILNTITHFGTATGGVGTYYLQYGATVTAGANFISLPNTITQNLFVDVNLGKSYVYEQNQCMSSKIGLCYPIVEQQYNTMLSYYYSSNLNDNMPITVGYPTNKNITVSFYQFDSNIDYPVSFPNYVLMLQFTPIV